MAPSVGGRIDPRKDGSFPSSTDPQGLLVGIAFRYPGASNITELATVMSLRKRTDTPRNTRIDQFGTVDTEFFKISAKEAYQSSPIFGTLLEVVAECILDSGIGFEEVTSRKTGMYVQSNACGNYMELTCNAAHYFNCKGPVLDFGGMDASPTNAIRTAILDIATSKCEIAIVVGICVHERSLRHTDGHTANGDSRQQECFPETVVALLIMSPRLKSQVQSRLHCEILHSSIYSDVPISSRIKVPTINSFMEMFARTKENNKASNMFKIPCSETAQEMFKRADSISALMGIIVASHWDKMPTDDLLDEDLDSNRRCQERETVITIAIKSGYASRQRYDVVLRKPEAGSNAEDKRVKRAVLIPTAVHDLVELDKAEESINTHQSDPNFTAFLLNSDFCQGIKDQMQPFYYYFNIPGGSYISKQDYTIHGDIPVAIAFDDFLLSPWELSSDFLNIPAIETSVCAFDEILRTETGGLLSLQDMVMSSKIPATTEQWGIVMRMACQMAVVDLMKTVNAMEDIVYIKASGLGAVAALYADGALTRTQSVKLALAMESALLKGVQCQNENIIVDVICTTDAVYQLGPWVQVLCRLPRDGFRISAARDKRDMLISQLVEEGFAYQELPIRIAVFTPMFRHCVDGLNKSLQSILPIRSLWSSKLKISGFSENSTKPKECTPSFFISLLCTPYDAGSITPASRMESYTPKNETPRTTPTSSASASPTSAEEFEVIEPDPDFEATPSNNFEKTRPVPNIELNIERNQENVLQEIKTSIPENISTHRYSFLMPHREAESFDCSTNGIRGSYVGSLPSESISSELQSTVEMSENCKSTTSQSPPTTPRKETVCKERHLSQEMDSKKLCDNAILELRFFSAVNNQHSSSRDDAFQDSSIRTIASSDSSLDCEEVQIELRPDQISMLQALAWIHGSGNRMDAAKQLFGCGVETPYLGDFEVRSLWAWSRQPCYQVPSARSPKVDVNENMTIHSLSPKPRLSETILYNLIVNRPLELETETGSSHSSDDKKTPLCPFDSSLLLLSGYKWNPFANILSPLQPHDGLADEKKFLKQVRFSYRKNSFLCVNGSDDEADEEIQALSLMDGDSKPKLANDLQFGFADSGDVMDVLNCIKTEDFHFISILQIDECLEKYLMDLLYTFPVTSALHVFFTPKLRATSTSKYVITISRIVSIFEDKVVVVLRDRSTDHTEICTRVSDALKIISSFEEGIYDKCLARVFELPMFLDDGSFSVARLESLIFNYEMKISRDGFLDHDKNSDEDSLSASSGSYEVRDFMDNPESKDNTEELSSKCVSDHERSSRGERNSSPIMMTNFYINFERTCVGALSKLCKINDHVLALIRPKLPHCEMSDYKMPCPASGGKVSCFPDGKRGSPPNEDTHGSLSDDNSNHGPVSDAGNGSPIESKKDDLMYLISVRNVPEFKIFMYCRAPHEMSRWKSIREVVDEVHNRHRDIAKTHEAFVSKCDENILPFEELLFAFMNDCNYEDRIRFNERSPNRDSCIKYIWKPELENAHGNEDNSTETLKDSHVNNSPITPHITITVPSDEEVSQQSNNESPPKLSNQPLNDDDPLTTDELNQNVGNQNTISGLLYAFSDVRDSEDRRPDHSERTESTNETTGDDFIITTDAELPRSIGPATQDDYIVVEKDEIINEQSISSEESTEMTANMNASPTVHSTSQNEIDLNLTDKENYDDQITSPLSGPENDSNKENTLLSSESEVFIDFTHLKEPQTERFEEFATLNVTSAIVVHLTDKISSYHQQKGRAAGNMLLYVSRDKQYDGCGNPKTFLGIVLFDDMDVRQSRFRLPDIFMDEHLETTLNYILAWYAIRILTRTNKDKAPMTKVLVQPPIQRDSAAVMVVAGRLGCEKIVSSSHVEELQEDVQMMVSRCEVLTGDIERSEILRAVGKDGLDVILMFRQQEVTDMLDLLAPSGCLVLCGDVDRTREINMRSIANNGQITLFDALSAARHITTLGDEQREEFQDDLDVLLLDELSELDDYFPPSREGYFYQVLGRFSPSKSEEQPRESYVHDIFFSTTRSLLSVFESIPTPQRKMLVNIFEAMSKCPGDDGCPVRL